MIRELYRDYETHGRSLTSGGFWSLAVYRFGRWAGENPTAVRRVAWRMYRVLSVGVRVASGVVIDPRCRIGDSLHIAYCRNIRIHPNVVIGRRCGIMQDVMLGETIGREGVPVLGDDVYIGPGAKILGPVKIGDGALIAANSLVITSVPKGATAMGVPARVIPQGRGTRTRPLPPDTGGRKGNGRLLS